MNVALPAIAADLGEGFAAFQWVLDGYLVALASLVLLGGSLGDLHGRQRLFGIGALAFGAASGLCALAPSLGALVTFRVLQGAAAALLVPSSLSMLQAAFAREDRGRAVGAWSGWSGLATVVGPLLGGWLVEAFSWRAAFAINPPLALLAWWLARRHVPESRDPARSSADWAGAGLAVLALAGAAFALIEGPERGWTDPWVLAAAASALVAGAAFRLVERRRREPMLPPGLARVRRFVVINALTLLVYFVLGGTFFLLMVQLQRGLAYSPLAAGAATAPVTLLLFVLSPVAGSLAERFGPRWLLTAGPLVAAAGTALLTRAQAGASYVAGVLPGIATFGLGLGLTVAPVTAAALAALETSRSGLASGVNNAVARCAQLFAVALLPLLAGLGGLEEVRGDQLAAGFERALWIGSGVLAAAGLLACATLRGPLGRQSDEDPAGGRAASRPRRSAR